MNPQNPQEPIIFTAPFDHADADLILRSSDNVHFRVYKAIMKAASPVFAGMFSLPDKHEPTDTGPQTVPLSEDGKTLDWLLRLCYPLCDPSLQSIDDVSALFQACEKYQMEEMMKQVAKIALCDFLQTEPVRVYAIACLARAEKVANLAALQCLLTPFTDLLQHSIPASELHSLSAAAYGSLLNYHSSCGRAAASIITSYNWHWVTASDCCWFNCQCDDKDCTVRARRTPPYEPDTFYVHPTWKLYMEIFASTLQVQPVPAPGIWWPSKSGRPVKACKICQKGYVADMAGFLKLLRTQVERAVAEVRLVFAACCILGTLIV